MVIPPGYYYFRDEESTGGIGLYAGKLPADIREINPTKRIPPGITSSWKLILTGKIKMRGESSKR
jgi:hypothetical protein